MVRAAFGRTAEIAEMSWDEVRWDEHAQVATVCWFEMKTSKTKAFALSAGKTRQDDVYLKGGDWFATNQAAAPAYDSSSQDAYVFPTFKSKRNSGTSPVFPAQWQVLTGALISTFVLCRQDRRKHDERRAKQSEQLMQMNHTQTTMATVLLQLQQAMQQNQNFALHCFTTPGLATAVTPSVGSPGPHTPAPPGAFPVLLVRLCIHVCMFQQVDTHLECVPTHQPLQVMLPARPVPARGACCPHQVWI